MPFYNWVCDHCQYSFEEFKTLSKFKKRIKCPKCKKKALYQNYNVLIIINETRTLGALEDKNAAKMGRYEKDAIIKAENDKKIKLAQRPLPKGIKGKRIPQTNPISSADKRLWRKINKMTQKEKAKYIITGEL